MSRPRKNNADYFTHDNDMRNDEKIKAVRHKFGLPGYAVWCMILEKLCKADNFELSLTKTSLELISGDFEIEKGLLQQIIDYFIEIDLLQRKESILSSFELKNRFSGLLSKRKRERKEIIVDDNPQRKGKESIVKESKEEKERDKEKEKSPFFQKFCNKIIKIGHCSKDCTLCEEVFKSLETRASTKDNPKTYMIWLLNNYANTREFEALWGEIKKKRQEAGI